MYDFFYKELYVLSVPFSYTASISQSTRKQHNTYVDSIAVVLKPVVDSMYEICICLHLDKAVEKFLEFINVKKNQHKRVALPFKRYQKSRLLYR